MNRRTGIAVIVVLGLLTAAYAFNQNSQKTMASTTAVTNVPAAPAAKAEALPSPVVTPSPAAEPVSVEKSSATPEPTPQSIALPDVDPRKGFGSKNAPVVIEVFSDFQCPACRQLYAATNRQLVDNFVNTGKVYLIHRDFPLQMHAYSKVAALYGRAASQIGKYEPVEQTLFENQEKWGQSGDVDGTVAAVLSPADMTKVRNLLKTGAPQLQSLIDKDLALGRIDNVNQTPTTIFHSKGQTYPVAGAMTFEVLKGFVDQLLGQK